MAMARLASIDAWYHEALRAGRMKTIVAVWAFEEGSRPPGPDAVAAVLAKNAATAPALRERVLDVGPLAYPHWVEDPEDPAAKITTSAARTWAECLAEASRIGEAPFDTATGTWRAWIAPGVAGVPGAAGTATVVVLQISHAAADGLGAVALQRTLLGGESGGAAVAGHGDPTRHVGLTDKLSGVFAMPRSAVWSAELRWRTRREPRMPEPVATPFNEDCSDVPDIVTFAVPRAAFGSRVTSRLLLAVSGAMRAVADDEGWDPRGWVAGVPVAIPRYDPRAANSLRVPAISLRSELDDAGERARAHAAELEINVRHARGSLGRDLTRLAVSGVPPLRRSAPPPARLTRNLRVGSYSRGSRLECAGMRAVAVAGIPTLEYRENVGVHAAGLAGVVIVAVSGRGGFPLDDLVGRLEAEITGLSRR